METTEEERARHLDSPPDRGFDFQQGDLEFVDGAAEPDSWSECGGLSFYSEYKVR